MGKGATRAPDAQRPAPPAPSGLTDQLDRTARQVRLPSSETDARSVHRLAGDSSDPEVGRVYRTACGLKMTARQGAVITTHLPDCLSCEPAVARLLASLGEVPC